jgi:predicted phage terminase large subunit-like protein
MTALKRARQWRTASRLVVPAKKAQAEEPHPTGKREPYLDFLRRTLPKSWTVDAPHIRLIAEHLDKVRRGEIDRLAIHMPPRHGKSESVTYRFPICWHLDNPGCNVLVTGYNQRFANKFGRRTRNLAAELGMVSGDKAAMDEWETNAGGLLMTRGVGSPPTGTGFNLIVIDDPVRRRQDAESETVREATWDWYTDDLYQRLEPGGAIVLIMTLWHEDDIGARAVASEPGRWTVLKLPAIALDNDPMGRQPGGALWPDRYPVEALQRIRDVMARNEGERAFEALYQQNPTPREGSIFKVSMLDFVDAVPAGLPTVRKWDVAATQDDGDLSCGAKMSGPDKSGIYYVEHIHAGQWESAERNRQMRLTAETDGREVKIIVPEDPGSAGKDSARAFITLLAGFPVKAVRETGNKAVRADPFAAQVNAGNVRLVRGDWNRAYVEELRQFTGADGGKDDRVDASSGGFSALARPTVQWDVF